MQNTRIYCLIYDGDKLTEKTQSKIVSVMLNADPTINVDNIKAYTFDEDELVKQCAAAATEDMLSHKVADQTQSLEDSAVIFLGTRYSKYLKEGTLAIPKFTAAIMQDIYNEKPHVSVQIKNAIRIIATKRNLLSESLLKLYKFTLIYLKTIDGIYAIIK